MTELHSSPDQDGSDEGLSNLRPPQSPYDFRITGQHREILIAMNTLAAQFGGQDISMDQICQQFCRSRLFAADATKVGLSEESLVDDVRHALAILPDSQTISDLVFDLVDQGYVIAITHMYPKSHGQIDALDPDASRMMQDMVSREVFRLSYLGRDFLRKGPMTRGRHDEV
jgi:hypothetical protein